ncbi:virulence RhuM family protein [Gallibacterium anatis]|uniref:virulence RhuM family protein n=1 Tax=Gallibacterium anatis TaxID=750 RepID=UPI00068C2332|nr:virulence RhuM family protein [Gallibacterium anatis]
MQVKRKPQVNNPIIIYNTEDGKTKVSLYTQDGTVWLNQNQLAELFATSVSNINKHIANILKEGELSENSVIEYFSITAADGKNYNVAFYRLEMILAIGFRVRSKRGTQFRQWANTQLAELMKKGFVMDDERLKNPDGRPDYFDELLERVRDIRASEKRFYQKVRELFALSSDYDRSDKATQMFFAETQNKLIYAVTQQTAAELIVSRADANAPNMALTSWQGSKVRKQDIFTAKNYLSADEIDSLNRLVVIFLESAELRVKNRQDLTLDYWRNNVDALLTFNDKPLLKTAGKITHKQMEEKVRSIYDEFSQKRKQAEALQADKEDEDDSFVQITTQIKELTQ